MNRTRRKKKERCFAKEAIRRIKIEKTVLSVLKFSCYQVIPFINSRPSHLMNRVIMRGLRKGKDCGVGKMENDGK